MRGSSLALSTMLMYSPPRCRARPCDCSRSRPLTVTLYLQAVEETVGEWVGKMGGSGGKARRWQVCSWAGNWAQAASASSAVQRSRAVTVVWYCHSAARVAVCGQPLGAHQLLPTRLAQG